MSAQRYAEDLRQVHHDLIAATRALILAHDRLTVLREQTPAPAPAEHLDGIGRRIHHAIGSVQAAHQALEGLR